MRMVGHNNTLRPKVQLLAGESEWVNPAWDEAAGGAEDAAGFGVADREQFYCSGGRSEARQISSNRFPVRKPLPLSKKK